MDLQLTVRADTPEVRQQLLDGVRRIAEGTARAYGVPENLLPMIRVSDPTPPVTNDSGTAQRVKAAIESALGPNRMSNVARQQGMVGEDFAEFVTPEHRVRGVYFRIGGTPRGEPVNANHSPLFKIAPEPVIRTGIEAMTVAAMELLGKP